MSKNNQKDELITQLLRETLGKNISWSVVSPPYSLAQATESYVPVYLETNYKSTRIGVYEIRNRNYTDYDEFYWSDSLGICIVHDPNDVVVWQVEEYSPALSELFQLAREQASGLNNILGF